MPSIANPKQAFEPSFFSLAFHSSFSVPFLAIPVSREAQRGGRLLAAGSLLHGISLLTWRIPPTTGPAEPAPVLVLLVYFCLVFTCFASARLKSKMRVPVLVFQDGVAELWVEKKKKKKKKVLDSMRWLRAMLVVGRIGTPVFYLLRHDQHSARSPKEF